MIKIVDWSAIIYGFISNFLSDIFKRIFKKKKNLPENIEKDFKTIQININQNNQTNVIIEPILENDFLIKTKDEFTTKDKELKIRYSQKGYEKRSYIYSHRFIYLDLQRLLTPEARIGFQLHLSSDSINIRDKDKLDYTIQGIKSLKSLQPILYKWFEIFETLNLNGNLKGIILPIVKYLKNEPLNQKTKEGFTTFIENLSVSGVIQPTPIGNKKISIVRVGNKNLRNYLGITSFFQNEGSDIIIICGRGKYISKVVSIADIFKRLYKHIKFKQEIISTTAYENKEHLLNKSGGFSCFYIYLFKLP